MRTFIRLVLGTSLAAAAITAGCKQEGENQAARAQSEQDVPPTAETPIREVPQRLEEERDYAAQGPGQAPNEVTLVMTNPLRQTCGLREAAESATATYHVQSERLRDDDDPMIEKLATCMSGELRGKTVTFRYYGGEQPAWLEGLKEQLAARGIPEAQVEFISGDGKVITPGAESRVEIELKG